MVTRNFKSEKVKTVLYKTKQQQRINTDTIIIIMAIELKRFAVHQCETHAFLK